MGTSGVALNKVDIINAIHSKKGVIQHAAQSVPCDPSAIYLWMKKDPEVKQAVDEARSNAAQEYIDKNQVLLADAYEAAFKLLKRNDGTLTIFILKTLGGLTEQERKGPSQCIVRGQLTNDSRPIAELQAPVVPEAV